MILEVAPPLIRFIAPWTCLVGAQTSARAAFEDGMSKIAVDWMDATLVDEYSQALKVSACTDC